MPDYNYCKLITNNTHTHTHMAKILLIDLSDFAVTWLITHTNLITLAATKNYLLNKENLVYRKISK